MYIVKKRIRVITYAQGTVFLFKEYFSIIEIVMNAW